MQGDQAWRHHRHGPAKQPRLQDPVPKPEAGRNDVLDPRQADVDSDPTTHYIYIYRVPQKYRLKVYGSEGHKNGANQTLILCMFFSTSGHLV